MKAALCSQTCFVCTFGLVNTKASSSPVFLHIGAEVIKQKGAGGRGVSVALYGNKLVKITLQVLGKDIGMDGERG